MAAHRHAYTEVWIIDLPRHLDQKVSLAGHVGVIDRVEPAAVRPAGAEQDRQHYRVFFTDGHIVEARYFTAARVYRAVPERSAATLSIGGDRANH